MSAANWPILVGQITAGEAAGFEKLYNEFRLIRFYFYRHVGSTNGDDLYHEFIIALFQQIRGGALREPERLAGYARVVASRMLALQIKRNVFLRSRECSAEEDFRMLSDSPTPEAAAIRRENVAIATRILMTLPKRDREVLIRFYAKEQGPEDIQRDLHLTETQYRLIKSRAKTRFAELVQSRLAGRRLCGAARPIPSAIPR